MVVKGPFYIPKTLEAFQIISKIRQCVSLYNVNVLAIIGPIIKKNNNITKDFHRSFDAIQNEFLEQVTHLNVPKVLYVNDSDEATNFHPIPIPPLRQSQKELLMLPNPSVA